MASNFFPMLSSSPPPIDDDDCFDDEEDDEFGAFKAADGALECSSFDSPDHDEASVPRVPELHGTCSPDTRRNVCTENGINGEFSVFSDCTLIHKKGKGSESSELAVDYCSCDNCVLTENLDGKMTLTDHPDSSECVDGEEIRFCRNSVDAEEFKNLETHSGEPEACRLGAQNTFCEISLQSGHSQFITKDLKNTSQEHSLSTPAFADCTNVVSPQLLLSQEGSSPASSIGDSALENLCDETQGDLNVISETVCHSLLHQEISRTSNSLDIVSSENSAGTERKISESVLSDSEDYKSKFTLFSAKQNESDVSSETAIGSPSLNISENVQSYGNGPLIDESVNKGSTVKNQLDTFDSEKITETEVRHSRIPVLDDLGGKLSKISDGCNQNYISNVQTHHDFVSDETFSKCHAETPDEFDDFQQAEFIHYEEQNSEDNSVCHEENSFDGATGPEHGGIKYSVGTFSCPVPNQVSENYQSQCSTETSLSAKSAGDFRTEDSLSTSSFADFERATFDNQCRMPSELEDASAEDSFADFESAASLKAHSILEPHSVKSTKDSDKGIGKISAVINAIFPVSEDATPSGISEEKFEIWEHNAKSNRLWDKLHEIEQTPGLRFQWGVSHSFQLLLRSVNVDYHSILRTSSVPFFASGLSLLEPTKGPVQPATKLENEEKAQCRKDITIPPVQFDWSSSGLVNPLDSTQATSTLMDLSFLSSTESNSPHLHMSSDFGLESEFLEPCYPASSAESNIKPPILQQLLSSTAVSSLPDASQSYRPSSMSQEAIHVLDQLPDLSFMRAKVLMFPVSSNI